jgi:uncharacterized protein
LIIDSACADFALMMRSHFRRWSGLPQFILTGALPIGWLLTGENLALLQPAALLHRVPRRPVLVIHGSADRLVPPAHGAELANAGGGEFWLVEGARHLGPYATQPAAYSQRVTQFFQAALS